MLVRIRASVSRRNVSFQHTSCLAIPSPHTPNVEGYQLPSIGLQHPFSNPPIKQGCRKPSFREKVPETLLWRKDAGNAPLDEKCRNLWREGAGNPPLEERCRKPLEERCWKPSFGGNMPETLLWMKDARTFGGKVPETLLWRKGAEKQGLE